MGTEQLTPNEVIERYFPDVKKLREYIPYLEKLCGQRGSNTFNQDGLSQHSLTFPVYDSNLLRFVKEAENTVFMNRNYHYSYSRYRMKTAEDELKVIENCTILQMDVIGDILSKYVLGGRTKSTLWSEAARHGVFIAVVEKADELIHFWETDRE